MNARLRVLFFILLLPGLVGFAPMGKISDLVQPAVAASGVNNAFGYGFQTPAYSWIELDGSGTEISDLVDQDDAFYELTGLFPLKFFENTYSSVYIGINGVLGFGTSEPMDRDNSSLPFDLAPNNLIAPFWDDMTLKDTNPAFAGKILYQQFGEAPNRYLVIEWHEVPMFGQVDYPETFEVVLYENGDILFAYQTVQGDTSSATVGMEDGEGVDGLEVFYNGSGTEPTSASAFRFVYPADNPRYGIKAAPTYQGSFWVNGVADFNVTLRNTGTTNASYEAAAAILAAGGEGANVDLSYYAGATLLTDEDSDGKVEVGTVAAGGTKTLRLRATILADSPVGDYANLKVTFTCQELPARSFDVALQMAVPAPFAQAYEDPQIGLGIQMNHRTGRRTAQASDSYTGSTMTLARRSKYGYVFAWERQDVIPQAHIESVLVDGLAGAASAPRRVTQSALCIRDMFPVVAVTEDGLVGVAFVRQQYAILAGNVCDVTTYTANIWFTVLTIGLQPVLPPTPVTQNTVPYSDTGVDFDAPPRLTETADNRFVLVWEKYDNQHRNLELATYDSTNGISAASALATSSGTLRYEYPFATGLADGRAFLGYSEYDTATKQYTLEYKLWDNGAVGAVSRLDSCHGVRTDVTQLSNGNMLLAWNDADSAGVSYLVLQVSGGGFTPVGAPVALASPNGRHMDFAAVTYDTHGQGIITTGAAVPEDEYLYYALIHGEDGSQITPTLAFVRTQGTNSLWIHNGGNATLADVKVLNYFAPLAR